MRILHHACDDHTSKQTRREVIAMILEAQRTAKELSFRQPCVRESFVSRDARNDCRTAAAQPTRERDFIAHKQPSAFYFSAPKLGDRACDSRDQIHSIARHAIGAFTRRNNLKTTVLLFNFDS